MLSRYHLKGLHLRCRRSSSRSWTLTKGEGSSHPLVRHATHYRSGDGEKAQESQKNPRSTDWYSASSKTPLWSKMNRWFEPCSPRRSPAFHFTLDSCIQSCILRVPGWATRCLPACSPEAGWQSALYRIITVTPDLWLTLHRAFHGPQAERNSRRPWNRPSRLLPFS